MAGLLNTSSSMMCPHGGTVKRHYDNTRVQAGGDFALRSSDTFLDRWLYIYNRVCGYHPCVQVQWVAVGFDAARS